MKKRKRLAAVFEIALEEFMQGNEIDKNEVQRAQAILLLNEGASDQLIKKITCLGIKHVYFLRKKFLERGVQVLKTQRKGRTRALLTRLQRKQIYDVLVNESPKNYGFSTDYWQPGILARLIKERYNVEYKSKTSIQLIFKESKFTYHKPDKQYKNRNTKVIDEWIHKQVPEIKRYIETLNTEVFFADEMILTTQTTTQRIWLPRGQFPKIDVASNRERRCVYGFFNINTGREFAFSFHGANSAATCSALEQLCKLNLGKNIVIVWDNAAWHRSEQVRTFLQRIHKVWLIALPPYAPELNPQEHIWKDGRHNVTHNTFIENIELATNKLVKFFNTTLFMYSFMDFKYD